MYRARADWQNNDANIFEEVEPTREELKVAERILAIWPTRYDLIRFDFIKRNDQPMISEVEAINPTVWIGKGFDEMDNRFTKLLGAHIDKILA